MSDLYETDFHEWAETQAGLLRNRSANALDWDNLAEEIGALARIDRREIRNRLVVLCAHLLKWQYQPAQQSNSWRSSVVEGRDQIVELIGESPSLRPYPAAVLARAYRLARRKAEVETGLTGLPETCPWIVEQVLDHDFWPASA